MSTVVLAGLMSGLSVSGMGLDDRLWIASCNGDLDKIEQCLAQGAQIDATTYMGSGKNRVASCTPLCESLEVGCTRTAAFLLSKGANPNNVCAKCKKTPLIRLSTAYSLTAGTEGVQKLLDSKANINFVAPYGSVLMSVICFGREEMVEFLISRGALIQQEDYDKVKKSEKLRAKFNAVRTDQRLKNVKSISQHVAFTLMPVSPEFFNLANIIGVYAAQENCIGEGDYRLQPEYALKDYTQEELKRAGAAESQVNVEPSRS